MGGRGKGGGSLSSERFLLPSPDCSHIEQEVHHVAVFDDILFTFGAEDSGGAAGGFGLVLDVIVEADDFGTDETALEVRVDDARGLRSLPAVLNGPRAHFLFSGGEVAGKAERLVPGVDDAQQAAFLDAVRAEHFALFLVGKPLQFFFDTGADFDDFDVARGVKKAVAFGAPYYNGKEAGVSMALVF